MAAQANIEIVLSNGQKAGETLKELFKTANRLNKEIKDLKPGSEEFVKKSKDLQAVNTRLRDVKNQAYGVNKATQSLLGSFSQFIPFGGQIQGITNKMGMLRGGVGGVSSQFGILRTAIISTGIGALIVVIGSLVAMFKSSEEGQDKWNKIMKVTGVIVGNLSDILASLGEVIFDAIVNPVDAAKKAWEGLKKFFTDPLGTIKEGVQATKDAISGFVDETKKEVQAAADVADLEAKTNRMSRELLVERKRIEADIAELRLKARQEDTYSADERLMFLNEANELQNRLLDKDLQIAENRAEIIRQTNAFSKSTKENLDAQAEAEAKVEEIQVSRLNQQRQIERERQRVLKEIERDEKAAAKEAEQAEKKKQEARQKALQDEAEAQQSLQDLKIEAMQEGIEKEIELIKLEAERKISALKGTEDQITDQRLLIEMIRNREIQAIRDQYRKEEEEKEKELQDKKDEIRKQDQEREMQALEGTLAFASNTFGGMAQLFHEGSLAYKAFAIAQAEFDTIQATIAAYKSTAAIPIVGPILAPIAAGVAFAFGQAKIAQIQAKEVPKASRGWIASGRTHAQGGIPGVVSSTGEPVEFEDGEIILTRGVSQDPAGLAAASDLNARYGGIRFFQAGGPVNPLSQAPGSGSAPGSIQSEISSRSDSRIVRELQEIKSIVNAWPTKLQVNNNLQDTREGINTLNKLESESNF